MEKYNQTSMSESYLELILKTWHNHKSMRMVYFGPNPIRLS